jgi:hypothetical protein
VKKKYEPEYSYPYAIEEIFARRKSTDKKERVYRIYFP